MIQPQITLNILSCRNIGLFVLIILMVLFLLGCKSKSEDSDLQTEKPIVSQLNEQHQIVVEFYGEAIGPDSEPTDHLYVDRILIRDNNSEKVEYFIPADVDTLQSSFGYFTNVWSPDNAYMALPLGRFQGFALFSSKTVMEDLQQNRFSQSIQMKLTTDDSTKLWHEFIGWRKPHSIHFAAGLSNKLIEFVFDPTTGVVLTKTSAGRSFRAFTKSGITEVTISDNM